MKPQSKLNVNRFFREIAFSPNDLAGLSSMNICLQLKTNVQNWKIKLDPRFIWLAEGRLDCELGKSSGHVGWYQCSWFISLRGACIRCQRLVKTGHLR
jgi:hypothetical protein